MSVPARRFKDPLAPMGLTERHLRLMDLLAQGLTSEEAAHKLCLSARSVETYRTHISQALGARTTAHLGVLIATRGYYPRRELREAVEGDL